VTDRSARPSAPGRRWAERTWPGIERARDVVAILPVGAVEAHGPHLPLGTDGIICEAMAEAGARRLAARGFEALVLPTVDYTAAPFAAGFRGTLSVSPETVTALVVDIGRSLASQGVVVLALANAHFDPANLASLHAAADRLRSVPDLTVVFPDLTRKPWALRLTDEFKSGACHAGRYEGSIVLATRGDLVDDERRQALPANPTSLSAAIREGKSRFEEIGGAEAYFGDPAAATAAEGRGTVEILGEILEQAVVEAIGG
jgi:creatinine amidohydrolase